MSKLYQYTEKVIKCEKKRKFYIAWEAQNNCHVSHVKSSGSMEGASAVGAFKWTVEKDNLVYPE